MYNAGECDYDPGPYHVTLPAGQIEVPFNASINDDVFESDETFQLVVNHRTLPNRISRAEPYSSTVTIMDDEKRKCFLYIFMMYISIAMHTYVISVAYHLHEMI